MKHGQEKSDLFIVALKPANKPGRLGAAAYRWEDLTKAPVSPSMLLNPRRYGDGAKDLFITLNCVQENIICGGQRDRSRRRPDGSRMPKSRAIKGIDEDMKLNKALWEMAEVLRNRGAQ
jgi:hypothetical protein